MRDDARQPRILTLDIENSPHLVRSWGWYEQTAIELVKHGYILMVGVKRMGQKCRVLQLPDYPLWKRDPEDDSDLMAAVWKEMDWADIIITQNGDQFDIKKLNTRFLQLGFDPPSPYKSVDTKKTSKRHFMFPNNKLDMLGHHLELGGKAKHEGYDLWKKCMEGDLRAWKRMAAYCKRDVELTEQVYLRERPWMTGHPNMNAWTETDMSCGHCSSKDIIWRGFNRTKVGKKHRFQCRQCGAWGEDNKTLRTTTRT